MRNVARALTRRDHAITGTLLRRPFVAASCKAINKVIDSTPVMEPAATAIAAAFSAVSLAGLESATKIIKSNLRNAATSHRGIFLWVTLRLEISTGLRGPSGASLFFQSPRDGGFLRIKLLRPERKIARGLSSPVTPSLPISL